MKNIYLLLVFIFIGFILHWLPNYNIPLQSDITWIYRLQTNLSNQLDQSIPYGLQVTGAYDRNFIGHFIKWYQLNGRYNIADNFALKSISHIAGEDANAWRLITVIIVCLGVWIFYLIGLSLGFPKGLFFLLCLSLYLYPLDIWIDYRSTEPRAFLLLSLSILTAIRLKRYMWYVFSSALFLLAVLTKETFIIYWVLFPIILYLKKPNSLRRTLIETVPYIGAVAILSVFVLLLKINIPLLNSGYIFSNVKKEFDIFSFIFYYARQLNTGISYYFSVVLFMTFIFILIKSHLKRKYVPKEETKVSAVRYSMKILLLCLGLLFLHGSVHYITNRIVSGRYVLPANAVYMVLVASLLDPVVKKLKNFKVFEKMATSCFILTVACFVFSAYKIVLPYAIQNRVDQDAWQLLISTISEMAPRDAHIVLQFDDPRMIETAQSLEANTLLKGRGDLIYHLEIENASQFKSDNGFLKYLIYAYNAQRKEPFTSANDQILYVKATRNGLGMELKYTGLLASLYQGKKAYLQYKILLNNRL